MRRSEQKNIAPCSERFLDGQPVACMRLSFLIVSTVNYPTGMSFLSTALQRRAESRHLNQTDIAKQSGISRSFVSRLFSGEFTDMSDANFTALLNVFVSDAQAQAEIIAARCMDTIAAAREARVPGAALVDVVVKTQQAESDSGTVQPHIPLTEDTERAFAWLRSQCPLNPDLEKHLVGYARLMGMK
jgi:transcriptional regulator with XRE-family HTH domain